MIAYLAGPREEANKFYNDISDGYQRLLSRGADREFKSEMEEIKGFRNLATAAFRSNDPNAILNTVKTLHDDAMPKIKSIGQRMTRRYGPGKLPPAKIPIPGVIPPSDTELPAPGTEPTGGNGNGNGNGARVRPWYMTGGVDWRILGGVGVGLVALTMLLRRK